MTDDKRKFESWEEVIKDYIGGLSDNDKIDEYRDFIISNFLKKELLRASADCDEGKKNLNKVLKKIGAMSVSAKQRNKLEKHYEDFVSNNWITDKSEELLFLKNKTCLYNIWISRTLILGKDVYPASHISKMTHSSSGGLSINDNSQNSTYRYFSTSSLNCRAIDGAYPNAALSKNVKFLMLLHDEKMLSDELKIGNKEPLRHIASNEDELAIWSKQFQRILNPQPRSDSLAKQVYFPVGEGYHLLTVLKSSSIVQAVYDKYFEASARKRLELFRNSKNKLKFRSGEFKQPVKIGRISTTLSQPQNVSVNNGKRGGNIRLFSTQPPSWQSQAKPPITQFSLFHNIHGRQTIRDNVAYLRDFLLRFERIALSVHTPDRKKWIFKWVLNIVEEVFVYVASIHQLPAGWSNTETIKLKKAHQYFLDPFRDDDEFQSIRASSEWQSVICNDFATWLNNRLRGKEKKFTPAREYTRIWKKIMEKELRDFTKTINMQVQNTTEAVR